MEEREEFVQAQIIMAYAKGMWWKLASLKNRKENSSVVAGP